MPFLFFVERVGFLILAILLVWQVVVPLLLGRPVLPTLRFGRQYDRRLAKANEDIHQAQLEAEVIRKEREAAEIRLNLHPKENEKK